MDSTHSVTQSAVLVPQKGSSVMRLVAPPGAWIPAPARPPISAAGPAPAPRRCSACGARLDVWHDHCPVACAVPDCPHPACQREREADPARLSALPLTGVDRVARQLQAELPGLPLHAYRRQVALVLEIVRHESERGLTARQWRVWLAWQQAEADRTPRGGLR